MESILTVRMDSGMKESGSAAMRRLGYTPSQAVRKLFQYAAANDALPFEEPAKPSKQEVRRRMKALAAVQAASPCQASDDDLKAERMRERYGIDA